MSDQPKNDKPTPRIVVMKNGSYHVHGNVPLVHKTQAVSECGEPLTWQKDSDYGVQNIPGKDFYSLCRCGASKCKPFCDGAHRAMQFDGTETADPRPSGMRAREIPGGERIIVMKDALLCMESGFCGMVGVTLEEIVGATGDTMTRALLMAMVERCPSGALTYRIAADGPEIEPDLPVQVAVTTEITAQGPIEGPLWVTGNIPIERADGVPFETRSRVTLCNCGLSCLKPLCDGAHRRAQEAALKAQKA
jgi:CDGSH-type Zn-finger protein